ncbi:IS1634 family transposase [Virgibacillus dakarensis]|uniref:IS1634 family transposase n=1 Tax=Virgibacillus dakarensis TaxID=1917889 RepID=UPI000B4502C2|nr:IS1634 family transposase [Virgibacillus dakarensis]
MKPKDRVMMLSTGPSQLISAICDEIGFEDLLNEQIEWDESRCKLSPGARLKALVINILSDREPLYHVEQYFEEQDVEMLFGSDVEASHINEYALGRALDALYEVNPWKVYSTLAISACHQLGLPLGRLHNDTTSYSLYGEYNTKEKVPKSEEAAEDLEITHGFSKQHRPDLKQIVLGMSVTPERIPILATVENGNTDDKTWNFTFIQKLRNLLSEEEWGQLIYQADSALITLDNLREIRGNLHFISRLPETFSLSSELKEKAWKKDRWEEIGQIKPQKKAASYKLQSFTEKLDGFMYRFVVVYSDKLNEQKEKTFLRKLGKERIKLEKAIDTFESTVYHCESDAKEALEKFEKENASHYFQYSFKMEPEEQTEKRKKRGRPKKNEVPNVITVYRPHLQCLEEIEEAVEEKKRKLSTFILITDKCDRQEMTDLEILQTYKGQEAAETRFRVLKSPQMIDGFFLKKPSRVAALGIVFVMALLVYGILENRVREKMKQEEKPLNLAGNRKLFNPTGQVLLKELKKIKIIYIQQNGETLRFLPDNINEECKRILELAGYDMTIYVSKQAENTVV